MSKRTVSRASGRRPLRRFLAAAAVVGAVLAYRNAVADTGGSYDPADRDDRR